jgi:hypothetical protein
VPFEEYSFLSFVLIAISPAAKSAISGILPATLLRFILIVEANQIS